MGLRTLNCPNCGASLDVENGLDTFFCKYCGNRILLEKSDAAYQAETAERQFEHERATQERKYQNEQAEWERQETSKKREHKRSISKSVLNFLPAIISFSLLILLYITGSISNAIKVSDLNKTCVEIEEAIDDGNYDHALLLANRLHLDGSWAGSDDKNKWDTRREEYIRQIRLAQKTGKESTLINPPISSDEYSKCTKAEVYDLFSDAGYNNIITKPVEGSESLFSKKGKIKRVTIDGKTEFSTNDTFADDAEIVIYFYEEAGLFG